MNRIHLLISTMIVLAAATVFAQQRRAPAAPRADYDRTTLLAQIDQLEDRITRLENEVRQLRAQRPIITTPAVPGPVEPLPPGWKEGEFNGLKYYIVPCAPESAANPTTRPTR